MWEEEHVIATELESTRNLPRSSEVTAGAEEKISVEKVFNIEEPLLLPACHRRMVEIEKKQAAEEETKRAEEEERLAVKEEKRLEAKRQRVKKLEEEKSAAAAERFRISRLEEAQRHKAERDIEESTKRIAVKREEYQKQRVKRLEEEKRAAAEREIRERAAARIARFLPKSDTN